MLKKRIGMSLLGVIICAISVGIFKEAALGVDPFQSLMAGLDSFIPISFGTLYVITNAILLLFSLIFDRHYIGIATFINLFLLGYITEYSYKFIHQLIPDPSMAVRIICLIIGVVIICFGSSFYMTADLGVSTYDAIPLYLSDRKYKVFGHVLPFRVIRIGCDLLCVLIGFLLGWMPGIGTIITALFMGPLITFFRKRLSDPLLQKQPA